VIIRDSIVPPKVLTSIIYKGAKETIVATLKTEKDKATSQLNDMQTIQAKTYDEISDDVDALKSMIFQEIEQIMALYEEQTKNEYKQKNSKLKNEILKSMLNIEKEIERVNSCELSDSRAIIIGLNAAFSEPQVFEKTCQDYIENYFLMKECMKENESLCCARKLISKVEPWNGMAFLTKNRYLSMIVTRSIQRATSNRRSRRPQLTLQTLYSSASKLNRHSAPLISTFH
jgi:hypothetical protein